MKKVVDFIKKHLLIFVGGAFMLILALVFVLVGINHNYAASLDVLVVPTDAKVLIGGQEYKNGVYEDLRVGKTLVQISREGFESQEFEIDLKRDEKNRLYILLEGDEDWFRENVDEGTLYLMDIINEYKGELETAELKEKYPIMSALPIVHEEYFNNYAEYVNFRVDGGLYEECEREFCLKITDISGGNRERALEAVRAKGYNPDDYEVLYVDVSARGHA